MKSKTSFVVALMLSMMLFSCIGKKEELKLLPVKMGKLYGYVDQDGKIVINAQFADASVFREGLALVKLTDKDDNNTYGFIDTDGKYAINPIYESATTFSDGLAWVVMKNGAPAAIDKKGNVKFTLQNAAEVYIFRDGLAAYRSTDTGDAKWGFVNEEGVIKINPQFKEVGYFSEGKCAVSNTDKKWGFIDKDGKLVINYQFDKAAYYINNTAIVRSGEKYGVVDGNGKFMINPQFDMMANDGDKYAVGQDEKFGWCNKDGKFLINPQFKDLGGGFFGKTLAPVKSGDKYGYVDADGKLVITPQFKKAMSFYGKYAFVMNDDNKFGAIDKDGKYAVNPQFDEVSDDILAYLAGFSDYERVESDYFDVSKLTDRVKADINASTVLGINLSAPFSTVADKYALTPSANGTYLYSNNLVSGDKISNGISLTAKAMVAYPYDRTAAIESIEYDIDLDYKFYKKTDDVIKALEKTFAGFTKDYTNSTNEITVLKSASLAMLMKKSGGDVDISFVRLGNRLPGIEDKYPMTDTTAVRADTTGKY